MVAIRAFSGLVSVACALASAAAIAPIDSLERDTVLLRREEIEPDSARLRSLGSHAVAGCFFRVFRHQGFELGLGPLMVEERRASCTEEAGELRPRIQAAHVDHANCFDARPRRFDPTGPWRLAGLDAAPKPALSGDEKMLVERIGGYSQLNPLPPPVMIDTAVDRALVTHMLCWSWAICFSIAASSENDHGRMNLASNTASRALTNPSSVAADIDGPGVAAKTGGRSPPSSNWRSGSKRWRPSAPSSRGASGFYGGPDETGQPSGLSGGG
jgi:hypothetical protein